MTYSTKDLYLVSYLLSEHIPMLEWVRTNNSTVFSFSETPELLAMIGRYYADTTLVSPIRYGIAMKHLKNLIHLNHNNYNGNSMYNTERN